MRSIEAEREVERLKLQSEYEHAMLALRKEKSKLMDMVKFRSQGVYPCGASTSTNSIYITYRGGPLFRA